MTASPTYCSSCLCQLRVPLAPLSAYPNRDTADARRAHRLSAGVQVLGQAAQLSGTENLRWAAGLTEPGRQAAGCLG